MRFCRGILGRRPRWGGEYLVDCLLETVGFVPELSADVDVGGFSAHGEADDECAFDEFVWVSAEYFSVFAGAGF